MQGGDSFLNLKMVSRKDYLKSCVLITMGMFNIPVSNRLFIKGIWKGLCALRQAGEV